jgi:hypothetical protein
VDIWSIFVDICYILLSFGIVFPFWYVVPGKIWQPWCKSARNRPLVAHQRLFAPEAFWMSAQIFEVSFTQIGCVTHVGAALSVKVGNHFNKNTGKS